MAFDSDITTVLSTKLMASKLKCDINEIKAEKRERYSEYAVRSYGSLLLRLVLPIVRGDYEDH